MRHKVWVIFKYTWITRLPNGENPRIETEESVASQYDLWRRNEMWKGRKGG